MQCGSARIHDKPTRYSCYYCLFFSFCYFCFWFVVFLELARPRMQFANQLTNKNKQRQAKIHMYLIGEQAEMHLNTFVRTINDKC